MRGDPAIKQGRAPTAMKRWEGSLFNEAVKCGGRAPTAMKRWSAEGALLLQRSGGLRGEGSCCNEAVDCEGRAPTATKRGRAPTAMKRWSAGGGDEMHVLMVLV